MLQQSENRGTRYLQFGTYPCKHTKRWGNSQLPRALCSTSSKLYQLHELCRSGIVAISGFTPAQSVRTERKAPRNTVHINPRGRSSGFLQHPLTRHVTRCGSRRKHKIKGRQTKHHGYLWNAGRFTGIPFLRHRCQWRRVLQLSAIPLLSLSLSR